MNKVIEQMILRKLERGPMWANSFRHAKPVVESLVKRGVIVRIAPVGSKSKNMLALSVAQHIKESGR